MVFLKIYRPDPDSWVVAVNFKMSVVFLPEHVEFEIGGGSTEPIN